MTNQVARTALAGAGLAAACLLAGCSGASTGTASPQTSAAMTTTTPTTTTTIEPPATTTTTTTPVRKPPKPYWSRKVRVSGSSSLPIKPVYRVSMVQVISLSSKEIGFAIMPAADGKSVTVESYGGSTSMGGGDSGFVTFTGFAAGEEFAVNNMVVVVNSIHGGHAELTVGTRYR